MPEPELRFVSPMLEVAQAVEEVGGEELRKCYQCGTCTSLCPWGNLQDFSPRRLIEMTRLGFEGFEQQTWNCVSCKLCVERCPQQIDIPGIFRSMRAVLLEWGANPVELNATLGNLRSEGNPWGECRSKKGRWAEEHDIPAYGSEHTHVLFACCANEYDPRNRRIVTAAAHLLGLADVPFGHLGGSGTCCGDQVHSLGGMDVSGGLRRGE